MLLYGDFFMKRFVPALLVFWVLAPSLDLAAEFYKYVDENGVVHYVDDPGIIPEEFIDKTHTYTEQKDFLPEKDDQRSTYQETPPMSGGKPSDFEDKSGKPSVQSRGQAQKEAQLDTLIKLLKQQQQENSRVNKARGVETPVKIRGNMVLVPVILGYGRNEIVTSMILDTGANVISIHEDVAEPLNIRDYRDTKVRVAGGEILRAKMVELSYVKVGPHVKKNIDALLLEHQGRNAPYDGLLGTNFLRSFPHTIDFKKSVIRWQ
jgi:hypothetical protein